MYGDQCLLDLAVRIQCLNDQIHDGPKTHSKYFFIENTFYDDMSKESCIPLSKLKYYCYYYRLLLLFIYLEVFWWLGLCVGTGKLIFGSDLLLLLLFLILFFEKKKWSDKMGEAKGALQGGKVKKKLPVLSKGRSAERMTKQVFYIPISYLNLLQRNTLF